MARPKAYIDTEGAILLRVKGFTYKEIGKIFDVSGPTVANRLRPNTQTRINIIKKYNGKCANCTVFVGWKGHVHHKIIDLDYNNEDHLELLCIPCHQGAHGRYAVLRRTEVNTKENVLKKEAEHARVAAMIEKFSTK